MPKSEKPRKEYKSDSGKNSLYGSGTMTTQEIVKRSTERMDPSADWENIYSHVYALLNQINLEHFDMAILFYFLEYKLL
jgi:high-affinity Fe2+/Pb2+ permease